MNLDYVFDDISDMQALWIHDSTTDSSDFATMADIILKLNMSLVSMSCGATAEIWPWVEKKNIKIINRFDFVLDKDTDIIDAMSELSKSVTGAFKNGAVGAQVFVHASNIVQFCDVVKSIRQDLFFDRIFSVAIDIGEMRGKNWADIFDALNVITPDAILITAHGDSFDAKSDFVGLIFDMLNHWNLNSDLHMWFGKNMLRVSQVLRLAKKIKPDLVKNMRVFTDVMPRVSE